MAYRFNSRKVALAAVLATCACSIFIKPISEETRQKIEKETRTIYETGVKSYKAGNYAKALDSFSRVLKQYSRTGVYDQAGYMSGLVYFRLGEFKKTLGYTRGLLKRPVDPELWDDVVMLDGEAHLKLGEFFTAARSFLWLCVKGEDPALGKKAEAKAKDILENKLSIGDLGKLHREFGSGSVDCWILFQLGRKDLQAGAYDDANSALEAVINNFPQCEYAQDAQKLLDVARLAGPTGRIGLLLALSGQFSTYGKAVKEGIDYALKGNNKFKVEVYDTGSTAEGAVQGATELIRNHRVDAIIGPVSSREALAVAPLANASGVVLVIPTATEPEIADTGPFIFQLNSYSYFEAKWIGEFAVRQLHLKRFGVFYPEGARGEGLAQTFAKVVGENGGTIVSNHSFDPEAKTFKDEVWEFRSSQPEAIFVPASAGEIELIAPYLDYGRIRAKILGTDEFLKERVARMTEKCMVGAVFVAPAAAENGSDKKIDEFYTGFKNANGREPSDLTALGYDASTLLFSVLVNPYTRSGLKDRLRGLVNFEGVTGKLSFSGAEKVYKIYTIKDGKFEEVTK
jgi:branched-chain amino acid transport system substrate-binding protein